MRKTSFGKYGRVFGFTLIEMMVTVAVFTLLATATIVNFRAADDNIALDSIAQKIASEIRRAQIYGISVLEQSTGQYPGYGVVFSSAEPDHLILFKDIAAPGGTPNRQYDGAGELVENILIESKGKIWKLCGDMKRMSLKIEDCGDIGRLDISFLRPDPDAALRNPSTGTEFSDAEIILTSPKGFKKTIVVWTTGQITVE